MSISESQFAILQNRVTALDGVTSPLPSAAAVPTLKRDLNGLRTTLNQLTLTIQAQLNEVAALVGSLQASINEVLGGQTFITPITIAPISGQVLASYDATTGLFTQTSGDAVLLQTNGTDNGSQILLNLQAGTLTELTDDGEGNIRVDFTGGGAAALKVNTALVASPNFSNTTPAATSGNQNVAWQIDVNGNISGSVPIGGGAVTTVFGRAGVVVATNGDYTISQITGLTSALAALAPRRMTQTLTGTSSLTLTSDATLLANTGSASFTTTLPNPATYTNFKITYKKISSDSNTATLLPFASEQIEFLSSLVITLQGVSVDLITDGTNWFVV